ncbi:MAG: hypothetical protein LBK69_01845, partial [Syntrophomonadaceae bacterium]|nr:hypothetical protein [Syntrophomonadaceae bacterium]
MRKPSNFLDELIRVRSDTGTLMEQNIAKTIYDIIASDAYFQEHPELFGAYDAGDRFNRPVVWALKRGKGEKTIIFSG